MAVLRLVHAGVVVMNTANVLTELQYNHLRPTDEVSGQLFGDLVPPLYYDPDATPATRGTPWAKVTTRAAARPNMMLGPAAAS